MNSFLKSDEISRILCVKRAQQGRPLRPPLLYFYSRPCTRGDWLASRAPGLPAGFLLTPLREGRPLHLSALLHSHTISTRAPTRGATSQLLPKIRDFVQISTHAPTRGATALAGVGLAVQQISTRAPTRGATCSPSRFACRWRLFLLAPLHEGRQQFFTKP